MVLNAHACTHDSNGQCVDPVFTATASGFEEVGALPTTPTSETGAIFSNGKGHLELHVFPSTRTATFTLTFSGLSAPVLQSHIHFGKRHVPGGIIVFFCTNLNNGPPGTQACPANGGTVTGTFTAADVRALPTQNFPANDFDAVVAALNSDTVYLNIHTTNFPAGEIRGQVRPVDDDDKDK
jgi:hypothetical protein